MHDVWIAIAIVLGLFVAQGVLESWLRRRIDRAAERRRAAWVVDGGPNPPGALRLPAASAAAPTAAPAAEPLAPVVAEAPMADAVYTRRRALSAPIEPPPQPRAVRRRAVTSAADPAATERRFESTLT